LSLKDVRVKRLEKRLASTIKEKESSEKNQAKFQETINDLQKLNEETTEMYKNKLSKKENELEAVKKDLEASQDRIYMAVNDCKNDMKSEISNRDVEIEKLK
jgi:ElaB/YqjD/DUF883 family membrane-anchored ribosome-binding protein